MKRILILGIIILIALPGYPQNGKKSRKEVRMERNSNRIGQVKTMVDAKNYIFDATHAIPLGGSSFYLNYPYDLTVKGDSAFAYLPYFGVAYFVTGYGDVDGGIEFKEPIKDYLVEPTKTGKQISFEVKAPKDTYYFLLSVSKLGYATLEVTCINRQPIQFYGSIEEIRKK